MDVQMQRQWSCCSTADYAHFQCTCEDRDVWGAVRFSLWGLRAAACCNSQARYAILCWDLNDIDDVAAHPAVCHTVRKRENRRGRRERGVEQGEGWVCWVEVRTVQTGTEMLSHELLRNDWILIKRFTGRMRVTVGIGWSWRLRPALMWTKYRHVSVLSIPHHLFLRGEPVSVSYLLR